MSTLTDIRYVLWMTGDIFVCIPYVAEERHPRPLTSRPRQSSFSKEESVKVAVQFVFLKGANETHEIFDGVTI